MEPRPFNLAEPPPEYIRLNHAQAAHLRNLFRDADNLAPATDEDDWDVDYIATIEDIIHIVRSHLE